MTPNANLRVAELERELAACKARLAVGEFLMKALGNHATITIGSSTLHRDIRHAEGDWESCVWEVWHTDYLKQVHKETSGTLEKCVRWCLGGKWG